MATNRLHPVNRPLALIAAFGLAVAAGCSGAPASDPALTPSSTPEATVSPSATALPDPAAALEQLFDEPDLTARLTLHNELTSTDPAVAFDRSFEGTLDFAGSDERELYEHSVEGDLLATEEFISVGSEEWKRVDGGPWIASDATDDEAFLTKLDRIEGFESLGVEKKEGRDLHHLRASGPTVLQDWGPDDPRFSSAEIDMEFWVEANGTPVTMELVSTFTFTEGGQALELERLSGSSFDAVGGSFTIEPPDEVWRTFRSDALGYAVGYPDGVVVASADGTDQFTIDDSIFLTISSVDAPAGMSLDAWREDLVADLATQGAEFQDVVPARVGGREAQLLAFTVKGAGGNERLVLDMIVINNGRAFEIATVSEPDMEAEIRAGLATILTTFEFVE